MLPATVGSSRVLGAIVGGEVVTSHGNHVSFWDGRGEEPRRRVRIGPRTSSVSDLVVTGSGGVLVCVRRRPVLRITSEGQETVEELIGATCVAEHQGRLACGLGDGTVGVLAPGQELVTHGTPDDRPPVVDLAWLDARRLVVVRRGGQASQVQLLFLDGDGRVLPGGPAPFGSAGATHVLPLGGDRFVLGDSFAGLVYLPKPPEREVSEAVQPSMLGKAECADLLAIRGGLVVIAARGADRYQNRLFFHRSGGEVKHCELEFTPSSLAVDAEEQVLLVCGEDGELRLLQLDELLTLAGAR